MRWKWLSLLPFCLGTQTGQHKGESLPICQGLADEEEVPPLLPGPFGPIGWNGWGEKRLRQ